MEDAWYTSFFLENHLDHLAYPDQVASSEQVRFMVYIEGEERYYPCSDQMFNAIMARKRPPFFERRYREVLDRILALVESQIEAPRERDFLFSLLRNKYAHEAADGVMIPSRIEKRLFSIYVNRTGIEDPMLCEKVRRNFLALSAMKNPALEEALDRFDPELWSPSPRSLAQVKIRADRMRLSRMVSLMGESDLWQKSTAQWTVEDFARAASRPVAGDGLARMLDLLVPDQPEAPAQPLKILWLPDEAGEAILDLHVIRFLARLGHRVMVAFKEGPLFTKVDFYDAQEDESMKEALEGVRFIPGREMGKNDLVRLLRSDIPVLALSDGTRERTNLLLCSTFFARAFKEADLVVARGPDARRRFFDTHFSFTRNILSITPGENGELSTEFAPHHPAVVHFSHHDLETRAGGIIAKMREARQKGVTVMFYSGIIGSIPGRIDVAKEIMSTFVTHLRGQSSDTFVINPSEHFEPGMDADDLMFMWEIVQRSGYIDIWRFQTYGDIADAFAMLGRKIPPEWVGKDATFSTGCTKEMIIAMDVARNYPEMQIIGPPMEKFYRRAEYGVGKMYDSRLADVCGIGEKTV
ncbi:MAG: hypothetical protein KKA60_01185 [Proteobacteria bacterium]|nr:hypothetical protein [Pseudomonadota bacterium]